MSNPFVNIASHAATMAAQQPGALSVAVQQPRGRDGRSRYLTLTARELEDESNRVARGLERIGICRGTRTVLMVTPGVPFFVLTFALFKAGAIPVMVDPGMGVKKLKACLAQAAPTAFIGIPKAHAARVALGWARDSLTTCVTVGGRARFGGVTFESLRDRHAKFELAPTRANDIAAILFTSGSTGTPKGAVYTHGNFAAQIAALRTDYAIEPGERDLATFPLFALFGPALGMASIVPDMDASRPITADPRSILAAAQDFETTNLFASPALLDRVGRYGAAHGIKLPALRRVISAGAPALPESLERFATMLSAGVQIFPSYGATEALPLTKIGHVELIRDTAKRTEEGAGVCVGKPLSGVHMAVIRLTDDALEQWSPDLTLPTGQIGEICVKGAVVTRQYYGLPDATRLSKIHDATGEVWHRMGDAGYVDAEGRLWFCGRKAHRVVCNGETLFTIPCERVFDTHPAVRRTALVGVQRNGETMPVLFVERDETAASVSRVTIEEELRAIGDRYDHTRSIRRFLFEKTFPVDVRHNAKIFREALAAKAEKRIA